MHSQYFPKCHNYIHQTMMKDHGSHETVKVMVKFGVDDLAEAMRLGQEAAETWLSLQQAGSRGRRCT